jgi:tetratricopeptide (TPR) repeat protein/tRNA A-37 threonylcarbamoyl transferase component Bud32
MIGQTISHFKILEKLGEGGMGEVYKAQDLKAKRVVALKILSKDVLGNDRERTRILHEAQAATALEHANICTIREVVVDEGHAFVSMNFIAGRTLREMIKAGPLDYSAAIDYAIQIAEGLRAAHEQKIIHRDIKSANVIVTNVGGARITDFGLSRTPDRDRLALEDTSVGTTAYMSPEQLEGGDVDQQSDIWSLGVVMYEMIAGRLPFRAQRESAIIYSIMNDDPTPLSASRHDVPAAVDQVVNKALAKKWAERYHNAAELLEDLKKIQATIRAGEELPLAVEPVIQETKKREIPPFLKSRRTWMIAAAVVVVLAAVIIFWPRSKVPFAERDWVVVADFYDATGQGIFSPTLDLALSVSLEQSRYVNVVPRRRADGALARMKKSGGDHIYEDTAREIAIAEGLKVVVVPSITSVGDKYALSAVVKNAETEEDLRSARVEVTGQNEVLVALDELAREIRGHLGEPGGAISQSSRPLQSVTTRSLTGLRQYALGFDEHHRGNLEQARRHYGLAIQKDSSFALALGALGWLEYRHFSREQGIAYIERAVEYVGQTTEREAYSIRASHAIAVDNDVEEAAKIYEASVAAYPDASTNHNNLGAVYGWLGRHQDAADQYQEAIRAEPSMMIAYDGMVTEYLVYLGRVDLALEWLGRQMEYDPQSALPYYNLGCANVGDDDLDAAVSALKKSLELDAVFSQSLALLGHVYRLQGRHEESLAAFARRLEADDAAVETHYYMGIGYAWAGNAGRSRDSYDRYRRVTQWRSEDNPDNPVYQIELSLVLSRMGQTRGARAAANRAAAIDTTSGAMPDVTMHFEWARLYAAQGKAEDALARLQLALEGGYRDLVVLKYHPDFDVLRKDPRFGELLERNLIK